VDCQNDENENSKLGRALANKLESKEHSPNYAIKVLRNGVDEDAVVDFLLEQKYLAALTIKYLHPNIVQVHGISSVKCSFDKPNDSILIHPGRTFYDFVLNVKAHNKENLTSKELAAWCLANLPWSIDTIVRRSDYLRNQFHSCFPSDFNTNEELLMWDIYDRVLIKYSKMWAKDYSMSQQAVYFPNGGYTATDDFSTRQAEKIASILAKSNDIK
jgi:hypothetical protein